MSGGNPLEDLANISTFGMYGMVKGARDIYHDLTHPQLPEQAQFKAPPPPALSDAAAAAQDDTNELIKRRGVASTMLTTNTDAAPGAVGTKYLLGS